jgi:hypothetical protein
MFWRRYSIGSVDSAAQIAPPRTSATVAASASAERRRPRGAESGDQLRQASSAPRFRAAAQARARPESSSCASQAEKKFWCWPKQRLAGAPAGPHNVGPETGSGHNRPSAARPGPGRGRAGPSRGEEVALWTGAAGRSGPLRGVQSCRLY